MKTKILYIITKATWGGAQRYVYDLATGLPDGYEAVVAAGSPGRLSEKLAAKGVRTVSIPSLTRDVFFLRELRALSALVGLIRRERPAIIHLNSSKAAALGAAAARIAGLLPNGTRPRIVYTAHGWPFTEERSWIERRLIAAISWITMLLSHATIVLSERDMELARAWPGSSRLTLIPNGVRAESAFDATHARRILETDYGIPPARTLIGTIAELHPNKGLSDLITTLPMLPDDAHLVIVGDGELKDRLTDFAEQLGVARRISFLGFIPDAASLIPGFDVFVLSSTKEGMPFVILEAGSRGVPVVATDVGGIPEIIEDGIDGFLVPIHDCERLAARINETIAHPDEARRRASHLQESIATRFSFDLVTMPKTLALYATLPSDVRH